MKWAFWRSDKRRVADPGRTSAKSALGLEQAAVDDAGVRVGQAARMRVRMRRRLIGAAALLVGGAVLVPMMLDPAPRPLPDNIPIDIPSERTPFTPRLSLPAEAPAPPAAGHAAAEGVDEPPTPAAGEAGSSAGAAERKGPAGASAPGQAPTGGADSRGSKAASSAAEPASAARWFVQAAALSSESAAHQLSARLTKAGMAPFVERAESSGSVLYRVRLGPFASRDDAVKARKHLHAMGVGSNMVRVEQAER